MSHNTQLPTSISVKGVRRPRMRRRLAALAAPVIAGGLLAGLAPAAAGAAPSAAPYQAATARTLQFCSVLNEPIPEPYPEPFPEPFPESFPESFPAPAPEQLPGARPISFTQVRAQGSFTRAPLALPAGASEMTYLDREKLGKAYLDDKWGGTFFNASILEETARCVRPGVKGGWGRYALEITSATEQTMQGFRVGELINVTPLLVAGTRSCATLEKMYDDLAIVAASPTLGSATARFTYYVSAAVRAHHAVHVAHFQEDLDKAFQKYRTAVSKRTAVAPDAGAALKLMQAHQDYKSARQTFEQEELSAAYGSMAHNKEADYLNAELDVVSPLLTAIDARRESIAAATGKKC